MPDATFDTSELAALARDLRHAPARVDRDTPKAVSRGALNVKNEWRERWAFPGDSHLSRIRHTIDYALDTRPGHAVSATVGPKDTGKAMGEGQGALGGIVEHGTSTQAPIEPVTRILAEAEAPRFADAMGDLGAKALRRA